jgi:microcystin degradation protein MlrC
MYASCQPTARSLSRPAARSENPLGKRIASEFLDSLEQAHASGPLDGVYFCMHGAMASEEEWDPEGYLLEQARQLLGDAIPIVVSLDLHGILTDRILAHADAIVAYHTYPHVDFYSTGNGRRICC